MWSGSTGSITLKSLISLSGTDIYNSFFLYILNIMVKLVLILYVKSVERMEL